MDNNNNNEILLDEPGKDTVLDAPPVCETDVTPKELLKLAKWILGTTAILFLLGGIAEFIRPSCVLFEGCKTILPPIVTFYWLL